MLETGRVTFTAGSGHLERSAHLRDMAEEGKAARDELERKVREAEAQLQPMIDQLKVMFEEAEAKQFVLSDDARFQKQLEAVMEIAWDVSSSQSIARGFDGHVIANTFGVFYRQTIRLTRRAAMVAYNQCGVAEVVGDVDFTDWAWSPDLALGDSCPPLPASNLPPAACYVPPCTGQ